MSVILENYVNEINDQILTESILDKFDSFKQKIDGAVKSKDTKKIQSLSRFLPNKPPEKINQLAYKKDSSILSEN